VFHKTDSRSWWCEEVEINRNYFWGVLLCRLQHDVVLSNNGLSDSRIMSRLKY
jgi:hypothetical protein